MNYMVYIINWDKVFDNTLKIEKEFIQNAIPHKIINSSDMQIRGWINLGNDSWATEQLYKIYADSVENKYDHIFILYGDVKPEMGTMSNVITSSIQAIKKLNDCYIYTKSFTHNHWGSPQIIIGDRGEGIKYICATDFSFVGLSIETYSFVYAMMEKFFQSFNIKDFKSAWGFDRIAWMYALLTGNSIYRDMNMNMLHDISQTGYDNSSAWAEMEATMINGLNYLSKNLDVPWEKVNRMHDMLIEQYSKQIYTLEDFRSV